MSEFVCLDPTGAKSFWLGTIRQRDTIYALSLESKRDVSLIPFPEESFAFALGASQEMGASWARSRSTTRVRCVTEDAQREKRDVAAKRKRKRTIGVSNFEEAESLTRVLMEGTDIASGNKEEWRLARLK